MDSAPTEGRLTKVRKIGQGSYGAVYLATEKTADGKVIEKAVKRNTYFSRDDSSEYLVLGVAEINFLIFCQSHPFVVQVSNVIIGDEIPFDTALSPLRERNKKTDRLFFVMEMARGDLESIYTRTENRIFLRRCVRRIMMALLLVLQFLHEHGICHRDIKPENILVYWADLPPNPTPEDQEAQLKSVFITVADFGLAKVLDKTNSLEIMSAPYRAPEVASEYNAYNTSIDIWSAGVVMYFLITGNWLFKGGDKSDRNTNSLLEEINQVLPVESVPYLNRKHRITPVSKRIDIRTRLNEYYKKNKNFWPQDEETGEPLKVNDTIWLMERMITLDLKRPSAEELLRHPWFKPVEKDIISVQASLSHGFEEPIYDPYLDDEGIGLETRVAFATLFNSFNSNVAGELDEVTQKRRRFFDFRSMFLAMDVVDRCLHINPNLLSELPYPRDFKKDNLNIRRQIQVRLLTYSAYYLCYKFFNYDRATIEDIVQYEPTMADKNSLRSLARVEEILLSEKYLCYIIYRQTFYEITSIRESDFLYVVTRNFIKNPEKYRGKNYHEIEEEILRNYQRS